MPTVCDLLRIRGTESGSFRVGATAIPADDFHALVLLEPFCQGCGLSVREDVYRNAPLQIKKDRSVGFPLTKRKIIHSQDARRGNLFLRLRSNEPQERVRAGS